MDVVEVRGENFLSYPSFKLNLYRRGILLLQGPNGAGKSAAVAEAISWCLFGKTVRGYEGDEVIHDPGRTGGGKGTLVSLALQDDAHGCGYIMTRYRKHKTGKNGVAFLRTVKEGEEIDLSCGTADKTTARIAEVLGLTWETFKVVSLCGQGLIARFANGTDATRKAVLDEMLGTDLYARARDRAGKEAKATKGQLDEVAQRAAALRALQAAMADEIEQERNRAVGWEALRRQALDRDQAEMDQAASTLHRLEAGRVPMEPLLARREERKADVERVRAARQLVGEAANAAAAEATMAAALAEDRRKTDEDARLAAAAEERKTREAIDEWRLASCRADKEAASALAAEVVRCNTAVEAAAQRSRLAGDAREQLFRRMERNRGDRLRLLEQEARTDAALLTGLLSRRAELVRSVEELSAEAGAVCPTCGTDVAQAVEAHLCDGAYLARRRQRLETAQADLDANQQQADEARARVARRNEEIDLVGQSAHLPGAGDAAEQSHLEEAERAAAGVLQQAEVALQLATENASAFSPTVAQEPPADLQAALTAASELARRWTQIVEAAGAAAQEARAAEERARQAARDAWAAVLALASCPEQQALTALDSQILRAQSAEQAYGRDKAATEAALEAARRRSGERAAEENPHEQRTLRLQVDGKARQAEIGRLDEQARPLATRLDDLKILDEAFGPAGIRSLLLDSVVPELNVPAARYAQALSGGRLHVAFAATSELKSGEQRDRFDMQVRLTPGAGDYRGCSGGWQRRADLVQLFAFRQVAQRRRAGLSLLVLDEPLEYVDLEGVEQAVALIQEVAADLGTVILCSHNVAFQSYFAQRVAVGIDALGQSTIAEC